MVEVEVGVGLFKVEGMYGQRGIDVDGDRFGIWGRFLVVFGSWVDCDYYGGLGG